MPKPTITIISDGKPGHLAQSRGLADAIGRRGDVPISEKDCGTKISVNDFAGDSPGMVIVAGHRAYQSALLVAAQLGCPAIALMNPGWWLRRKFDVCVIPRHDGVAESNNVIVTEGALNSLQPAADSSPGEALLLIGGPSRHHHWEDESLLAQLHTLLARDSDLRWTATSSRRTPESTDRHLHELAREHGDRFAYTPVSETPRGWVAEQLKRCGTVWVTEDSVSMVYESLTAGARVGLLDVPRKSGKPGRVVRGVISLIERGWVTVFADWREGKPLPEDRPPLNEADRVADELLKRYPQLLK